GSKRCYDSAMQAPREMAVQITTGTIVKTLLFLALAGLLWYLRDIVLVVLTAVVIASAMEPGVHFFTRQRGHRVLAVILMYVIVMGVFCSVLLLFIPPVLDDAANFLQRLPATLSSLNITDVTHGLLPWGSVSDTLSSADLLRNLSQTLADSTGGVFT